MSKNNWYLYIFYYAAVIIATSLGNYVYQQWIIIYLGAIAIIIGITIQRVEWNLKSEMISYKDSITNIEFLREEQFYATLKVLIASSKDNIDLSHMSLQPPVQKSGSLQESYYKSLKSIAKKSNSHIRRVERLSKEKIQWIEGLIKDFSKISNFSLFIYKDPSLELQKSEMSALLSVQRVDSEHTFIVALNEHSSISRPRDIYFRSKMLTDYFVKYYQDRIIKHSECIIDNGIFNEPKWQQIKSNLT